MHANFCKESFKEAQPKIGGSKIFNTDQGLQFTCE
jgi:hypothetical protein